MGRVTNEVRRGADGTAHLLRNVRYDAAGFLVSEEDGLGHQTTFSEHFEAGHHVVTTVFPDGGTEVLEYYRDGQLLERRGTAVAPMRYAYGVEAVAYDGQTRDLQFMKSTALGHDPGDTNEWTKTYSDMLGRTVLTVFPDGAREEEYYNEKGQRTRHVDADGVTTLYTYDDLGRPLDTVVDMNRNGIVDWHGPDRIARTEHAVVHSGGHTWRRTTRMVWPNEGSTSDVAVVSIDLARADGREHIGIAHDLTNRTAVAFDPSRLSAWATNTLHDGTYTVSVRSNATMGTRLPV